jgi:hypothetical protein
VATAIGTLCFFRWWYQFTMYHAWQEWNGGPKRTSCMRPVLLQICYSSRVEYRWNLSPLVVHFFIRMMMESNWADLITILTNLRLPIQPDLISHWQVISFPYLPKISSIDRESLSYICFGNNKKRIDVLVTFE